MIEGPGHVPLNQIQTNMKNRNNKIVKFIVWCFLYFGDEPHFMVNKYRNILLWLCIIIYLIYKKDVLCNIKRLFFYA